MPMNAAKDSQQATLLHRLIQGENIVVHIRNDGMVRFLSESLDREFDEQVTEIHEVKLEPEEESNDYGTSVVGKTPLLK